jgi:hypothetical protein
MFSGLLHQIVALRMKSKDIKKLSIIIKSIVIRRIPNRYRAILID